jgi:cysteine synthase A
MLKTRGSVLDAIGNTPLVHLARIRPGPGRILAKLEFLQPGGSVKDRTARQIIEHAYATGELHVGQPVLETTSGNMGAGLAVVCAVTGNPFTAVMSAGNSPERVRMLRGLGAEVELVPQLEGTPGRVTGRDLQAAGARAAELARERGAYFVDQFNNPAGIVAHEEGTGPEIWRDTGGAVDAFVAMVGSGGTFLGTSRYLKRCNPAIRCFPVEPTGARVLAGLSLTEPCHLMQGAGYGLVPGKWDRSLADGFLAVQDDVIAMRARLARREGLYVGYTAAANVCAALQLFERREVGPEATVVTVLCDTGLKY